MCVQVVKQGMIKGSKLFVVSSLHIVFEFFGLQVSIGWRCSLKFLSLVLPSHTLSCLIVASRCRLGTYFSPLSKRFLSLAIFLSHLSIATCSRPSCALPLLSKLSLPRVIILFLLSITACPMPLCVISPLLKFSISLPKGLHFLFHLYQNYFFPFFSHSLTFSLSSLSLSKHGQQQSI